MIFDETAAFLAAELTGNALKVLFALPMKLDFRNWKSLPQVQLAEELRVSQSTISRAMEELTRHKVVERRNAGTGLQWRICRTIGYRGRPAQYHQDERGDRLSQEPSQAPLQQPALKFGPSRVIKGGRKTSLKPNISHEGTALHSV